MSRFLAGAPLRRTILLVVTALLLSQALGLLHRVVHAPQAAHATAGALAAHAPAADHGAAGEHWLDRFFAIHDADGCASYDQLAHSDFLWSAPPELRTAVTTSAVQSSNPVWHLAAQAAGYLARGPPHLT